MTIRIRDEYDASLVLADDRLFHGRFFVLKVPAAILRRRRYGDVHANNNDAPP